jgi:3-hydroxybutyrate dehydrogenase
MCSHETHGLPEDRVIREIILASQPNRRFVQREEISALLVFPCSCAAASITGSSISVDGGFTAR